MQESDELYLLSQESDASVKVRDGLMDVKRLEAVDGNGLEQWRPVLKGLFPLGADDLRTVLGALGVSVPELTREAYTLEQLVDEVVGASPALAAVAVHKRRVHYRLGDCMAELSEVTAGTRSARTIAVEAEDPELVAATVRELQLAERPNVCLARGLKTMLGLEPVRFAVIDVGTNSVKLHVGERRADGSWQTVADRAEVTRLGEGLQDTGLAPAGAAAADRGCRRRHGRGGPARRVRPRSPPSRPPGCVSPGTPPSSSRPCASAAASASR